MAGTGLMVQVLGWMICGLVGLFGAIVIVFIWQGRIDISQLLSEAGGAASLSRFQLLVVTFVVTLSFVLAEMRVNSGGFPDIPRGVLILLAISTGTFLIGKLISDKRSNVPLDSSPNESLAVSSPQAQSHSRLQVWTPFALVLPMAGFLGFAVYRHETSSSLAAFLVFMGGLTAWFLVLFLQAVDKDGPPYFETNWGGLGGGLGGWRLSASLIYLICSFVTGAVVLGVFLTQVVLQKH